MTAMSAPTESALGLIETRGLVGAIEAADAMAKAAEIRIARTEVTLGALVTVQIVGEVAAVQAALDAGRQAAERVGEVVSAHVIPRLAESVWMMQELDDEGDGPHAAMTVLELRALARAIPGFPLQGRAIARAKKRQLVDLIQQHE